MKQKELRYFYSPKEFFKSFFESIMAMCNTRKIKPHNRIPQVFLEKIMLAVAGVNECEYCSYLHTQTALEKGISEKEVQDFLKGNLDNLPEREAKAVLYAQCWADTKGEVSHDARKRVVDYYGEEETKHMEAFIKAVYFGTMCSNTIHVFKNWQFRHKTKLKTLLTFLLSSPIALFIIISGKIKAKLKRRLT